jgi:hypothetical protein
MRPLLEQHLDFLIGHRGAVGRLDAQDTEQPFAGKIEHVHHGTGKQGEGAHGADHRTGHLFGVVERNALGHKFAHHQREIGGDQHHQYHGQQLGVGRQHRRRRQPGGDRFAQGGAAKGACEHPDQGDADLNGREKITGIGGHCQHGARRFIAFVGHLLQARFAGGDHGHFGHGEGAVDHDQQQEDNQFQ